MTKDILSKEDLDSFEFRMCEKCNRSLGYHQIAEFGSSYCEDCFEKIEADLQ